jgi:hypothetical protein
MKIFKTSVKNVKDAQIFIFGDTHNSDANNILFARMIDKFLKDGDNSIAEGPVRDDTIRKLDDRRSILCGFWEKPELLEKSKKVVREQMRIEDEINKRSEKDPALEKELERYIDEFDELSFERSKCLANAIKDRMTRFPGRRLAVFAGRAHFELERELEALNLDKYRCRYVIFFSRHEPPQSAKSVREYDLGIAADSIVDYRSTK